MVVKRDAYAVAEGTQIHHNGVTYGPGETVPITPTHADFAQLIAAGWLVETTRKG